MGSPPLTREQQYMAMVAAASVGITPAYAGTTGKLKFHQCIKRDHPRLRGNNYRKALAEEMIRGSPPLTREQLRSLARVIPKAGITPAYAGTTRFFRNSVSCAEDHPRLRGNNQTRQEPLYISEGSPPLTREQLKTNTT